MNTRGVAFITYSNEANAQFAKEAMAHQSLDHNEILNVRWATADPNPMAQKREARRIEEQAAEAIRRALPAEYVAEIEGRDPDVRKRKRIEGGFGLVGYEAPDDIYYARGSNAVNPIGRQGFELEEEQRLMIEADKIELEAAKVEENGILSGTTLAALKNVQAIVIKSKKKSSGPLVAYDSESESD